MSTTINAEIINVTSSPEKDFELSLRLRNNQLKKRRLSLGLNQKQLAQNIGVNYQTYAKLESLRMSPLLKSPTKDGNRWKPSAVTIAAYFECDENELWPGAILAVTVPEIVTEIGADRLLATGYIHNFLPQSVPSPIDVAQAGQLSKKVNKLLEGLPVEEAEILRLRFGIDRHSLTLDKIGEALPGKYGKPRSKERVRQMEACILRNLRHPSYRNQLEPFYDELPGDPKHRAKCQQNRERYEEEPNCPTASKQQTQQAIRRAHIKKRLNDLGWSVRNWSETKDSHRRLHHIYQVIFDELHMKWSNDPKLRAAIAILSSRRGRVQLDTTTDLADVAALFTPGSDSSRLSDVKHDNETMADAIMELADKAVFLVLLCDRFGSELFCVPI